MSDELHYTVNTSDVHKLALQLLGQLPMEARRGQVQVDDLLNVLVFAATSRMSINQACQEIEGAPCGASVLGELARQLEDLDKLEKHLKSSRWVSYTLRSHEDGEVSFDMAVVCRNLNGKWKRHEKEALLYDTWGVRVRSLGWIRKSYRGRFGIESSYRQLNQARIRSSTPNPVLRLLFVRVALILRDVWVWLHAEVRALPRQGARVLKPVLLRFGRLLLWLLVQVAHQYRLLSDIPIPRDFREISQEFGLIFNY